MFLFFTNEKGRESTRDHGLKRIGNSEQSNESPSE